VDKDLVGLDRTTEIVDADDRDRRRELMETAKDFHGLQSKKKKKRNN